ncbi:hypothetical protein [Gracilimonas sediminicola]|uniref:hypothetical protein n=1 Tax=Gracilimonas sediminicola TaxID=2952158 RepID=UPI0038D46DC3
MHTEFYRSAAQNLIENPGWKVAFAALFSLFHVPIEFIIALPIFWILDFYAGLRASRRQAKLEGKDTWFDQEKMRKQYGKITVHLAFLIGCVVAANTFNVKQLITFGFGWVIGNEFLFSTIPHLYGDKKAGQIVAHLKGILFRSIGIKFEDPNHSKEEKKGGEQ